MSASLTNEIARLLGVNPQAAETELKEYVQFLAREIQTKGKVEIGEVGTFFNSAAGLQFTPHDALARLVNREYAGLDPVVLEATDVKPGYRRNEVINTGDGEDAPLPVEPPPHAEQPVREPIEEEAPSAAAETEPSLDLEPESMHDLTAMLQTEPEPPAQPGRPEAPADFDPVPFSYQSMEEIIDSVESGNFGQEGTPREPEAVHPALFEQPLTVPGDLTDAVEDVSEAAPAPPAPDPDPFPALDHNAGWDSPPQAPAPEADAPVSPEEFLASLTDAEAEVPRSVEQAEASYQQAPPPAPEFPPVSDIPERGDLFPPTPEPAVQPLWEEQLRTQDAAPPSWLSNEAAPPEQPQTYAPPFSETPERPERMMRRPGRPPKEDLTRKYAIWGILGVIGVVALIGLGRFLFTGSDSAPTPEPTTTEVPPPVDSDAIPPQVEATEPVTADALETETPVDAAPLGDYALVIGSYPTRAEAEAVASEYTSTPMVVDIVPAQIRGAQWYRVALGSYATIEDAVRGKDALPAGLEDAWVSRVR